MIYQEAKLKQDADAPSNSPFDGAVDDFKAARAGADLMLRHALFGAGRFQPGGLAVGERVLAGSARVDERPVRVGKQDASHRGGYLGALGGDAITRTIRRASHAGVPVIDLPESRGARLRADVATLRVYGAISREQARERVSQVTLIASACSGEVAYSPTLGVVVVTGDPHARLLHTRVKFVEQLTRKEIVAEELDGPRVRDRNCNAHSTADDDGSAVKLRSERSGHFPSVLGVPLPLVHAADTRSASSAEPVSVNTRWAKPFGSAYMVMNSCDLGADLTLSWPGALVTIIGARRAVMIFERRAIAASTALAKQYSSTSRGAATAPAQGCVDEIILCEETREWLIRASGRYA